MKVRGRNLLVAGSTIAIAIATPYAAFAQNSEQPGSGSLTLPAPQADQAAATPNREEMAQGSAAGDIIVTAQKRSESVNTVPMSITAASGDQLVRLGISDPGQLQKIAPGFSAVRSRYGTPVYTIRGVGFQNAGLGANPTVSSYADEMPLPFAALTAGATLDLERVEILKGPQGTLFGNNATGGAINFVAAKPSSSNQAGFDVTYGRFDTVDVTGFIGGPVTGNLDFRVAANAVNSGPWQKSYTHDAELGSQNFLNARAALRWKPTDGLTALLTVSGFRDRSETQASQFVRYSKRSSGPLPAGYINYQAAPQNDRAADWSSCVRRNDGSCGDFKKNNRFWMTSLRLDYDLGDDISLTSLTSYDSYKRFQPEDQDGTTFENYSDVGQGSLKTFYQELRGAGSFGSKGHWVIGANYQHDKINDYFDQFFSQSSTSLVFGFLPLTDAPVSANQRVSTKAVFVNADYPILDGLTVEGGIRYTAQKRSFAGCALDSGNGQWAAIAAAVRNFLLAGNPRSGPAVSAGPNTCGSLGPAPGFLPELATGNLDQNNLSWRGGVKWTLSRDALLYANVSRGYKSGSFPSVGASVNAQYAPVTQESLLAYEAGFKLSLLSRTLQLNGAAYYYDYTDKQVDGFILSPIFGPLSALRNVPKSRVMGFELSANWLPVSGLSIAPAVSMADSKITRDFIDYNALGQLENFKGQPFQLAPKWQASADLQYEWDISPDWKAFVGSNISFQGKTAATLGSIADYQVPSYTLLDLRAGVERDAWRFSIWGRNVTDKYYWTAVYRATDAIWRFAGRPATYGMTLSYRIK